MNDIVMPRLSDSMTEGTVVRWLKAPGETIVRGEPLVEIETDKATITYESDVDGVLTQLLVAEGQTVAVGAQIAIVEATGAASPPADQPPAPLPNPEQPPPLPTPDHPPVPEAPPPLPVDPTPPQADEFAAPQQPYDHQQFDQPAASEPAARGYEEQYDTGEFAADDGTDQFEPAAQGERVKASPIARRLARKLGVDVATIAGSGPDGRVVKEDVEAAADAAAARAAQVAPTQAPAPPDQGFAPPPPEVSYEPQPPGQFGEEFAAPGQEQVPSAPPPPPMPQAPVDPPLISHYPPPPQAPPPGFAPPGYPPQPPGYPPPQFPAPPPFVQGMTGGFPAVDPNQPQQPPAMPPAPPPPPPAQPAPAQPPPAPPPVQPQPPAQQAPGGATATRGSSTPIEPTNAQQTVARRMAESKATAPEFFVETEVDMTMAVAFREQLRATTQPLPSYNDFVIKAAALALRQYPNVNAAYKDGHFEQYSEVNIGLVVSSTDVLAVPTLFNVDQKGLSQIAREAHELSDAVRSKTIQPAQLSGGTFSISNLGMYGVERFTAILNPPQAAILAVGAITRRAVIAEDGMSLVVRQMMAMTLTCDHRILYGAEAAEFLAAIKAWLENPQMLQV